MGNSATVSFRANGEELTRSIGGRSFRIGRDPDSDLTVDNPYRTRA